MKKLYTFLIIVCTVFTVNAQTPTTWDGTGWSNGDPQFDIDAIINGNLTLEYDLETKNLTIVPGVTLTLPEGTTLSVFGDVVNNGSIIVESDANFIQKAQASNNSGSGTATVKRVAHLKKNDFNYWGSPVSGQKLYDFSEGYNQADPANSNAPGTPWYDFYVYDEATDYFVTTGLNSSTVFTPGKGYAIRGKNKYGNTLTTETFTFNGPLNNGDIPITLARSGSPGADKGYNLVANPYPSNINAVQLLNNNNSTDGIVSTLWFWTNINAVTSQQGSGYSGNNYAILNKSGGISATNALNYTATPKPTIFISVAQGFIVQAKTNSSVLQFSNSIRGNGQSNFYNKGANNKEDDELEKDRYWLKLISPQNIVNTILVAYVDGATNNYDEGYDADLMVVGSDSFYSLLGAHKLQIQGRKPGLDLDDVVPLGNKHYVSGTNTIALDDKNGIFANGQPIYLKDKLTGTVTNLQDKSYSFDSAEGEFTDRFEIIYKTTLAVSENATKNIAIFKDQSDFVIRTKNPVQNVEVYDMSGRMIQSSNIRNNAGTDIRIDHSKLNKGVYVIRVNQDGQIFTQKVIK